MYSPLLNIVSQYAGAVLAGLLVGLICKAYFASQMQRKIRDYQGEIVKSHSKILELEATNYRLEKKVKDVETSFSNERLVMN
jgi:septal ring factor EnvC (AmiA/AmiB activator)